MDGSCFYCSGRLGRNRTLEQFPIGRRLAFDGGRGRLWVVCPRCERWNLAPTDERWEAIDACERLFRGTSLRLASANIGLATLPRGLELIRIGNPLKPELAAWRYGWRFSWRRRRLVWGTVAGCGAAAGAIAAGPVAVAGTLAAVVGWQAGSALRSLRVRLPRVRVPVGHGDFTRLRGTAVADVRVLAGGPWGEAWGLSIPGTGVPTVLAGADALRAAGVILARINRFGASAAEIDFALDMLDRHGDASSCFRFAGPRPERDRYRLARLPIQIRLALEMAAHEETEARILRGELALYAHRWRQAEAIAAEADSLLLPAFTLKFLERHRPA